MDLSWVKILAINLMLIFIGRVPKISFGHALDNWSSTHNLLVYRKVHLRKSQSQANKLLLYYEFM